MKVVLTEFTKSEINKLNAKYGINDDWDKMSDEECLISDAGMYSEGAYEENEFDDLDIWCRNVGLLEYQQTYLNTHPHIVRDKINEMLNLGLIEIK